MSVTLTVPRADLGAARRCCVLESGSTQCGQLAAFWVGTLTSNGIDDYTEVCGDHVRSVYGPGDIMVRL